MSATPSTFIPSRSSRSASGQPSPRERLAYGEQIEYSGPTLDGLTIAGNLAILTFKHVGGGLVKPRMGK